MVQQQVIKFRKLLAQSISDSTAWIPPRDAKWKDMWYIVSTLYTCIYNYVIFPKSLDISRQVKNLRKATELLSLSCMFQHKLLSSSVN